MSCLMEYKGYHAKIEFSSEDNTFIGRVIGINDTIAFDGNTVDEIREAFCESINDYLETCAEIGKEPDKEYKGTFNIRISPELHKRAFIEAEAQNISLNQFVQQAIEHEISGYNGKESITIVMPTTLIEKYKLSIEQDAFNSYNFSGKETLESCQQTMKFPDFVS